MAKGENKLVSQVDRQGTLFSRLDYPVSVKYGDSSVMLHPRGQLNDIVESKLGILPTGVTFRQSLRD